MLPVSGVYVRWIMVAVVHEHGDAEESADFWHVDTPTIQPMQIVSDTSFVDCRKSEP